MVAAQGQVQGATLFNQVELSLRPRTPQHEDFRAKVAREPGNDDVGE